MVQWLRLYAASSRGMGSIPGTDLGEAGTSVGEKQDLNSLSKN